MKRFLGYILLALIAVSCTTSSDSFRLKGQFKSFNQGELFIYSLSGNGKIDTVKLMGGKFTYDVPMEDTLVLSVVFPNFSEIPVVAVPGTSVKMEGDASHLREVAVTGTDENEQLTQFRLKINEQTPPEALKTAEAFVKEHPSSVLSLYILNKYFLQKADADYSKVSKLLSAMTKAAPDNRRLQLLQKQTEELRASRKGQKLPKFSAVDTEGKRVSNADLKSELNVIIAWSSWNYESQNQQRQFYRLKKDYGSRLQLFGVCLDGNPADCKRQMERDSITWHTVCDGKMWAAPIVGQLGIYGLPDIILVDKSGKIIMRSYSFEDTKKKIEELLKK